MDWYIAQLVVATGARDASGRHEMWEEQAFLCAPSVEAAYDKAERLGRRRHPTQPSPGTSATPATKAHAQFLAVSRIYSAMATELEDGEELTWYGMEVAPSELQTWVKSRDELELGSGRMQTKTGWYIAEVVVVEVYAEASQGDPAFIWNGHHLIPHENLVLVWNDYHLVAAATAEDAYQKAWELGQDYAASSGLHTCNGDQARFAFAGVHDLYPTEMAPADESVLWVELYWATADERAEMIPTREQALERFENANKPK